MKNVHIISHSHWDREWYMPFEKHRMRLVELIDNCIELFETDPAFSSFCLDGQSIVIDDYLAIKPQNREKIEKYIKEGRFFIGPWYILQDEWLTSGESNVRNLLVGMKDSAKYGNTCKIGYFPDSFGNVGQMPQLMKQAGIDTVIFGRGVRAVGFNNELGDNSDYKSQYSEMVWQSPDGSKVLGILFANWYNNAMEIPENNVEEYWKTRLANVEQFASTNELLMMNGCDHQPVQKNLSRSIEAAKKTFPEYNFIHSNFPDYVERVKKGLPEDVATIKGELMSQQTDGWTTLANTASTHVGLKQMNKRGEMALESVSEPLSVMASLLGKPYMHDELTYAWKTIMQNHPHDSICGCSVDEVNEEMYTRFNKSRQTAEFITEECLKYLGDKIDTSAFEEYGGAVPFAVFNTASISRSGMVTVSLDIERIYSKNVRAAANDMRKRKIPIRYMLIDTEGNKIPCSISDMGINFGYDLPNDKFRQSYMARTLEVTFEAKDIPAFGYKLYALAEGINEDNMKPVTANSMENRYIRVDINKNGTLDLTDKETGKVYKGICGFENTGDIGNEYIFREAQCEPIYSYDEKVRIELAENTLYRTAYKIITEMEIPCEADSKFDDEQRYMIEIRERKAGRSSKTVTLRLETLVSLESESRGVKIECKYINNAKNHRLRILIPTDLDAKYHKADSMFELTTRSNKHNACWKNPSGCEHQQRLVSIDDGEKGITVANVGLYEYEILPERNTIAVTLLRAVSEMGDWGVFPTEKSQLLGEQSAELIIYPHKGDVVESGIFRECYNFGLEFQTKQLKPQTISTEWTSIPEWSGNGLLMTGLKEAENGDGIIARWVNMFDHETELVVSEYNVKNMNISNVIEETINELKPSDGVYRIPVKAAEIVTLKMNI